MAMLLQADVNCIDAVLFGAPTASMRDRIASEHNAFIQSIDPGWGGALIERTKNLFNAYNSSGVLQMVQNALNQVVAISKPDVVFQFSKLSEFQTAQPVMQAYLMANPYVRDMYHRNLCDGYSDTYVDPRPGVIGFGHQQFEQVMNGVVVLDKADDDDGHWVNYSGAWTTEDQEALPLAQKAAVLNSWFAIERCFKAGDAGESTPDPTSPWGASL